MLMAQEISLKTGVELGVVPTHAKFVGALVPDEEGRIPRDDDGEFLVVSEMRDLMKDCPVSIRNAQIPVFPGVDKGDQGAVITGLRNLGLDVHLILMIGGGDPMSPDDEDTVAAMLLDGVAIARENDIKQVSSTSIEEWMSPTGIEKTGSDYDAAVAQVAKLHARVFRDGDLANSAIEHWHIEFLRGGEFQTFTDLGKCWDVVRATNEAIGTKYFRILADAAHCGDSSLSIPENEALLVQVAEADELGIFHCSAKTTRGCLSTDDGWVGSLLTAAARTGKLQFVFVELFHHEDPALEGLRHLDPGHGIDTTDGRSYREAVIDGVVDVARRLNNLVARGLLKH